MASAFIQRAILGDRQVDIQFDGDRIEIDGTPVEATVEAISERQIHVLLDGASYDVLIEEQEQGRYTLIVNQVRRHVQIKSKRDQLLERYGLASDAAAQETEIKAPMPGLVLDVFVQPGDPIESGTPLLVLEAMKMENEIRAASAGSIAKIHVKAGDAVSKNELLIELAPAS